MDLPQKILISGASGLIGSALTPLLRDRGCAVTQLSRSGGPGRIQWDASRPIVPELVSGFDAVIHLAGESIVGRWTAAKKQRIRDSRVLGTRHLAQTLASTASPPKVLICASAIGYYGNRGDELLTEQSAPGTGFLPDVCQEWESASDAARQAGIRTVNLRTGLVLTASGGALKPMLLPFRMGLGGRVGDGHQWWSWIALQDLLRIIEHCLKTDRVVGPVNGVGPNPATNAEFTKTLAAVLSRPAIFPLPASVVKLVFGEMGSELLLSGQRVSPSALKRTGYSFQNIDLADTLRILLRK